MTVHCANCPWYNWPVDNVTVFRCNNCKYLSYCSPECQREHWVKVHKKHCNILAGKTAGLESSHNPKSCPTCKEEKRLGNEMFTQKSPFLGCIWYQNRYVVKTDRHLTSAVDFWKMGRKFPSRTVHCVLLMWQIASKLRQTGSQLSRKCPDELHELDRFLTESRETFILVCQRIPEQFWATFPSGGVDWEKGFEKANITKISNVSRKLGNNAGDPFLSVETFQLLAGFVVYSSRGKSKHKNFERLDVRENLTEEELALVDKLGTLAQFEEIWDSVLAALESGLVHHSNLVEIMCGGCRNQKCAQCQKDVIIEQVFNCDIEKPMTVFKKPFVTFKCRIFSCSDIECQVANRNQEQTFLNEIHTVLMAKVMAAGAMITCDFCSMMGKGMHRCSECKTKVYCSLECQEQDWRLVHRKICNKGEVARKVKGGKKERERAGKKCMEKLTAKLIMSEID